MHRTNESRFRPDALGYQSLGQSPPSTEPIHPEAEAAETSPPASLSEETEAGTASTIEEPLVTRKELWGWYLFEAASSGFSGSVLPIFLPLLLVTVATEEAWRALGQTTPDTCDDNIKVNCLICVPGKGDRLQTEPGRTVDLPKLRVYFGSLGIDPVSYTTLALGISVLFQVVTFISAGPLVDYGDRRKSFLTVNTVIGSVAMMLLFAVYKPELWWLGGLLCIISNVAYGMSYIAYNTYLPLLTDASPEIRASRTLSQNRQQIVRFAVENNISLKGITIGAVLSTTCVIISYSFALIPHISLDLLLRIACFVGGLWWFLGYTPSLLWLKRRPRPELEVRVTPWLGWVQVWELIKESRKHIYAWRFLVLFFIFADGYTTVGQIGILFASQELCLSTPGLAAIAVLVNVFVFIGTPIFEYIQLKLKWDNCQMCIFGLLLLSVLPIYGILGYIPGTIFGLKHSYEAFIFASWYGACLGPFYSYSRTLFIDLIPVGTEGAMFSLWSLSSKGSAWVGPIVVAVVVQYTNGGLRSSFIYTLVVILVPAVLLWLYIDNKEGLRQSGRLVAEQDLEGLRQSGRVDSQQGLQSLRHGGPVFAEEDSDATGEPPLMEGKEELMGENDSDSGDAHPGGAVMYIEK